MKRNPTKAPGSAHFGFFIIWACLVTIAVLLLEDVLSLSFQSYWHFLRFFLPFLLLVGLGIYLWERQKGILRELYRLSVTDALTGAYNREYLYSYLSGLVEDEQMRLSVAFIDVDNFKRYNDKHGHASGDLVLKRLVDVLNHLLVEGEIIARYGGDEFVVLLMRKREGAEQLVQKALHDFERYTTLSASAGIAHFQPGDDGDLLIGRADEAMYAKKVK